MLAYFDTSALVPLIIAEPATARCAAVWNTAGSVVTSALTYVETRAALAQAARLGRMDAAAHRRAVDSLEALWGRLARVAIANPLLSHAAELSETHALRGYDAVHCATAVAAASADFVAVSGDRDLLRAWNALGVATVDTRG